MKEIRKALLTILLVLLTLPVHPKEGMWMPILIEKLNIGEMQKMGLKLSAEDIYSVNQACLKDAIVIFGGGCTGEIISHEGLLLTNHHCGLGIIQRQSTMDNNYVDDGFWAMSRDEELPNPGLTATFLVRMEDVTNLVLEGLTDDLNGNEREVKIQQNITRVESEAVEGTHYTARVEDFFYGNEYYLFVYEVFTDVRLVGAPPSNIGKFGGDTDNWMWPRHTGDFSLFRVYANKNNEPAEYSPDNIPYKPKKYLPISIKGINEGDFTFVYGYPGSTQQYITSHEVQEMLEVSLPSKIKIRDIILEKMNEHMMMYDEVKLKYIGKYARTSNAWKKWKGIIRGLERLNAVEKKEKFEEDFQTWSDSDTFLKQKYSELLPVFDSIYNARSRYAFTIDYLNEAIFGIELIRFIGRFNQLVSDDIQNLSKAELTESIEELKVSSRSFYKDYYLPVDRDVFREMMRIYYTNVDQEFIPEVLHEQINNKFKGSFKEYADFIYNKSLFPDSVKLFKFLDDFKPRDAKKIKRDPAYELYSAFGQLYWGVVYPVYASAGSALDDLYRIYMQGIMEMQPGKIFYPDANFTMRITYGKVEDYQPRDAVNYNYFTTLSGVMEKQALGAYDHIVPEKLEQLFDEKDYGRFGVNDTMYTCFIASNHTSGGNSGSPVLDANGHLIGINFDRNWEGTMSDIMYDPDQCRNISLDMRYFLFIVEKYAGASYLIDEMEIIE
ncbi:MAG: S46 family peptidase [Bacteroidales bacterium]